MKGIKVIVGLGKTGVSCARYFSRLGIPFAVMDDRPAPEAISQLRTIAPAAEVERITTDGLTRASEIVLSPGVPMKLPAIQQAIAAGVPVTGDVAIFGAVAPAPIVAITGSNGKSTVTALVGELAHACGVDAGIGGNIGIPCLDLLEKNHALFVLEVSSYQLETATRLEAKVAAVLNLFPDHLDRYDDARQYYETKAAIYRNCEYAVVNRDTDYAFDLSHASRVFDFGAGEPTGPDSFGLRDGMLCRGDREILDVGELRVRGRHNRLNALAALAIGSALDWDISAMAVGLRAFRGLPHRCEWVGTYGGVHYINDSKSTNIGSTLAALEGLEAGDGQIDLILGGQGKGGDFGLLAESVARHTRRVFVYGQDRAQIATSLAGAAESLYEFDTLEAVMDEVRSIVATGEIVLFSPGCASLDQFENFEARGARFKALAAGTEERQ